MRRCTVGPIFLSRDIHAKPFSGASLYTPLYTTIQPPIYSPVILNCFPGKVAIASRAVLIIFRQMSVLRCSVSRFDTDVVYMRANLSQYHWNHIPFRPSTKFSSVYFSQEGAFDFLQVHRTCQSPTHLPGTHRR